ncbi:MAG: MFS transporter [Deltaproteobacteria bacterium]|nr:MFS transporter [Deltaproteobacteria bacterium]
MLSSWLARAFASLRHRNYRIYFAGQLVSLTGMWMQSAAQSWLVYELTRSKVMLGIVGAAGALPVLFFSTYGGLLADRVPRRRILVVTQVASSALALTLGTLAVTGLLEVWHIVTLAVLLGAVNGFDMPARNTFVVDLVDRRDLMNAIALNSSAFHGTRIIGPAVAGLVMAAVGPGPCFIANGLSYTAALLALAALRLDARAAPRSRRGGAAEGFRVVAQAPGLPVLFALTLVVGVFGWSYVVLLPAFATDVLRVGERGYGVLMAASGVGSVIGSLVVASVRDARHGRMVLSLAVGVFSPAVFAFASSTDFTVSLVLLGATGMGMTAFFSTANTLIQTAVKDDVRGRVMGIYALTFGLMMPLGALEAGGIAHAIGAPATVRIGAAVCAAAGVFTYHHLRKLAAP